MGHDADDVGADAEEHRLAQAHHSAVTGDEIEAGRGYRENDQPRYRAEKIRLVHDPGDKRKGRETKQEQRGQHEGAHRGYRVLTGSKPCGRKNRITAMMRYVSMEAMAGPAWLAAATGITRSITSRRNARPSVSMPPTIIAPRNAPFTEPRPPMTMTTNAR